jgi:hypothetical protein
MFQLHRFNRSLNLYPSEKKTLLIVCNLCSFFYSPSNTISDLHLYSLRNQTNTDVCSSIWRTQKLLDIYYICCVSLRYSKLSHTNPIMMSSLHNSINTNKKTLVIVDWTIQSKKKTFSSKDKGRYFSNLVNYCLVYICIQIEGQCHI